MIMPCGTPWKINMEPTVITHLERFFDLPNLHEDMFQPLIFRGVLRICNCHRNNSELRSLLQDGILLVLNGVINPTNGRTDANGFHWGDFTTK